MPDPLAVYELIGQTSSDGENPTRGLELVVQNTSDRTTARLLVIAVTPTTIDGLVKQTVDVEEEGVGYWRAHVRYGSRRNSEPGVAEWSFEIGAGGSQHITQSLETMEKYGNFVAGHKGAIGVRRDGNGLTVEGIDIEVTTFDWQETHHFAYEAITPAFVNTLYNARGKVNSDAFRIFAPGEVRFRRVTGSPKALYTVPLTFSFSASHNVTNLTIGDITNIAKKGWEHLWVDYKYDASGTQMIKVPNAVYVERIFDLVAFSTFNLPDPPWGS